MTKPIEFKIPDKSKPSKVYEGRFHFNGTEQRYQYPPVEKKPQSVAKPQPQLKSFQAFREYAEQDHNPIVEFDPKKTWKFTDCRFSEKPLVRDRDKAA